MGKIRKKYTEEQISKYSRRRRCRTNVSDTLRKYGINDSLYYRWKAKYGGMDSKSIQRLREPELDKWREKYNNERPHSASNYEPPSTRRRPMGAIRAILILNQQTLSTITSSKSIYSLSFLS